MKSHLLFSFLFILIMSINGYSQEGAVGIGNNDPHRSAILDIRSGNRGILIPRNESPDLLSRDTTGLLFYNTTETMFNYYDGSNWVQMISNPVKSNIDMDVSSINMSDNQINNLAAGTTDGDAVNFRQMHDAVIPPGGIIMWSGSTIPAGWALCDGSGGRPDLRDQFILGASTVGTYGTGGSQNHTTTNITYTEENLYTTAPANCSPYRYLYTFTVRCEEDEPGVPIYTYNQTYTDVPANSCTQARAPYVGTIDSITECVPLGDCTRSDNPEYFFENSNCETGATQRAVVTGLDNQPQFYRLAFIIKL